MLSIHTSTQTLNGVFSFLENFESIVVWMCTPNYERTLYVNKAYEKVWRRPAEQLLGHNESWVKTIVPEDIQRNLAEFAKRGEKAGYSSAITLRVCQPNGNYCWIKSTSYTLADSEGRPTAIIGYDEVVTPEQWHELTEESPLILPLKQDLFHILEKEYQVLASPLTTKNADKIKDLAGSTLHIDGKNVFLNRREMQCLYYLISGMSAKQTAYTLNLSIRTVETYLDTLKKKVNCRTKIALLGKLNQTELSVLMSGR